MLPPGFKWIPRYQRASDELALTLDDVHVAALLLRVDGGWTARLDAQRPIDAPLVMRRCTSFERGKAGVEAWAARHEARLRAEVAERLARQRR